MASKTQILTKKRRIFLHFVRYTTNAAKLIYTLIRYPLGIAWGVLKGVIRFISDLGSFGFVAIIILIMGLMWIYAFCENFKYVALGVRDTTDVIYDVMKIGTEGVDDVEEGLEDAAGGMCGFHVKYIGHPFSFMCGAAHLGKTHLPSKDSMFTYLPYFKNGMCNDWHSIWTVPLYIMRLVTNNKIYPLIEEVDYVSHFVTWSIIGLVFLVIISLPSLFARPHTLRAECLVILSTLGKRESNHFKKRHFFNPVWRERWKHWKVGVFMAIQVLIPFLIIIMHHRKDLDLLERVVQMVLGPLTFKNGVKPEEASECIWVCGIGWGLVLISLVFLAIVIVIDFREAIWGVLVFVWKLFVYLVKPIIMPIAARVIKFTLWIWTSLSLLIFYK
jgi:hypothetical protein